jgi:hypothetical protein
MNRIRAGIGAAVVAVALAAGGFAASAAASASGTRTVPETSLVTTVNSICESYAPRLEAVPAPSFDPSSATAAELGQAVGYLEKVVPLEQSEQHAVDAAGRPSTDAALYSDVLGALAARVADEATAETAAKRGDLSGFRAAFTKDEADSTRLSGIAQQFGLTRCA